MDGYDYLAGFLLLFVFFIYITWFGFSVKVENQKEQPEKISINPYDQVPLHRKLIDKKNKWILMDSQLISLHLLHKKLPKRLTYTPMPLEKSVTHY